MSQKEINRYTIIKKLMAKKVTGSKAAELLRCSVRHIWRLKADVEANGVAALVHGNCGKKSNRSIPEKERVKIVALLTKHYPDFGPTFATQHLIDDHEITHHKETIRQIMIAEELWKPRRGKQEAVHRSWRQRKIHPGELEQFDGSYHNWLEGRDGTDEQCLLSAMDATDGKIKDAQ